ncbi:efflux RND transporter periplasmic adaptor subunit [Geothrix sp. PMB-07]|uniref:efflux RND transporter periplasmic adaptor subunit n=1 Tax=Geothrix sp. PMB-07 TaxID=3068640 RepID=UPI002740D099|nr:efflux RND transporter periplasmic adaptor subunit [Geothrix sp. PMB-07]WLT31234.1 efflux RND transporter periplasmic adaptor subunit [Geothrix sp. PMB-07]
MSERPESPTFKLGGLLTVAAAALGLGVILWSKQSGLKEETRQRKAEVEAGPRVRVLRLGAQSSDRNLSLQGEALPFASTTLYAKVSGFLRSIPVDKGSAVSAGQVVAVVESPETDRDTQALQADADNKRRNAERSRALGKDGLLSPRDVEQAEADAKVAAEKLASQTTLKGYQVVRAPFSGVVTQRFADPGALVQNGGTTSSAQPLVTLAQVDRLRVTFYLDASVASLVKPGTLVDVRPAERPELVRPVTVSRVAGALDPRTRTLLAEADLDNRDGAFLAGGFVQVSLKVKASSRFAVPTEAVVLRDGKSLAAVVQADGRVRFQVLQLGEEEDQRIRVLGGLQPGDTVVLNPPFGLKDGDKVQATGA